MKKIRSFLIFRIGLTKESERTSQKNIADDLFKLTIEKNNLLTGGHGIGRAEASFIELEHGAVDMVVISKIKKLFLMQIVFLRKEF